MSESRAIGPVPPTQNSPRDWLKIRLEDGQSNLAWLMTGTRVSFERSSGARDYFIVEDFEHKGKAASVRHKSDGTSYLVAPAVSVGPASVVWSADTGSVRIRSPRGADVSAEAISDTDPDKLPDGEYLIRPSHNPRGQPYVGVAPHAWTWWLIEHQVQRGFFFHLGCRTLGCVTVVEHDKWESIYNVLAPCRTADGKHSGTIKVAGHNGKLVGTWRQHQSGGNDRWLLRFEGDRCYWGEYRAGNLLTRPVSVIESGGRFRIERQNDSEMLRFIGASDRARSQLLARGVNPSFMTFERAQTLLRVFWNGLFWTTDARGNLGRIEQPGTTSRTSNKLYEFEPDCDIGGNR